MNRYLPLIFLMIIFSLFSKAQNVSERLDKEWARNREENRKSNDPIYATGDTLYLFYDCTDSLQIYRVKSRIMIWKLREPTPLENYYISESCDLLCSNSLALDCKLYFIYKNSPCILSKEDVAKLPLTNRKEFMNFYLRELKRQQRKRGVVIDKRKIQLLSWYDFSLYFTKTYVLIPKDDGTFELYEAK